MADLGAKLVESLKAKQRALPDNKSDKAFAQRLGVSRELWQKTRKGTVPMARSIALAVIDLYGDLRPTATAFLLTPRGNPSLENGSPDAALAGNPLPENEIRQPQEATR